MYYGCISPLSFSEIRHIITSNDLLQLEIAAHGHFIMLASLLHATFIKKSYLDDSVHELLMIPHTNFEIFDDSTDKMGIMIAQVSIQFNCDFIGLKQTISI